MNSFASFVVLIIGLLIVFFVSKKVLVFVLSIIPTNQINHPAGKKLARAAIKSFVYNALVAIVCALAGMHPRMLVPFIIGVVVIYFLDKE